MKKMWLAAMVLVVCCLAPQAGEVKKDLDLMQGSWVVEAMVERGKKPPDDEIKALEVHIAKEIMTVKEKVIDKKPEDKKPDDKKSIGKKADDKKPDDKKSDDEKPNIKKPTDQIVAQFQLKLDPTKKPKTVDLVHTLEKTKGTTDIAIYEISGDTLRFCIDEEGKERPKEFVSTEKTTYSLIVLKRKK